ncbi:DUF3999 family protein [Tunturibacter empetritectus]|uniref:DUF3999 family protein n=1 Tax=Tunturiibacter lichenicola TaxID=2051959 RepID=A0A7W8N4J2_9BACT|nr:DUF3999 family protein [Edaphobacter lichenicola]MBB5345647.1 hypothetical protein [Edaphobacter lichenicola]
MKSAILLTLLIWQAAATPERTNPRYLRYERTLTTPSGAGQSCAIIDPSLFPHAGPSLKDLRLFQDNREIPYAITLSEPQQSDNDTATIRNLGLRGRNIVFDLEMPNRPYTELILDLDGHDFLATATVSGTRDPSYTNQTQLGEFTLFDLTSQHLSRSTTIHLQETSLPYLHIELAVSPATGTHTLDVSPQALQKMVQSATVPPSREAQSLYTTAVQTTAVSQRGPKTVATFALPQRIPIERVSFSISPAFKANFSRDISITDHPTATPNPADGLSETLAGTILRVHLTQAGREIRQEQLSVPATLGSNMQSAATVEVAVNNGDDAPLPITAIRLEMRQRKICFDAPAAQPLTLFYGDAALTAPQYDYTRLFSPSSEFHAANLGPEQFNSAYRDRPDARPLTDRHPHLLWIALLIVICILAIVAIRSSKTVHH